MSRNYSAAPVLPASSSPGAKHIPGDQRKRLSSERNVRWKGKLYAALLYRYRLGNRQVGPGAFVVQSEDICFPEDDATHHGQLLGSQLEECAGAAVHASRFALASPYHKSCKIPAFVLTVRTDQHHGHGDPLRSMQDSLQNSGQNKYHQWRRQGPPSPRHRRRWHNFYFVQ